MNLSEARAKVPALQGLDDQSAIEVLQEVYYPKLDTATVARAFGVTPAAPPEAQVQSPGLIGRAKDVGITALKGAIGVPEAAVGLADLVTGGQAGKAAEAIGFRPKEAKAILDEQYSDAQKAAFKKVQAADGFVDTTIAAVQNPSVIAHSVLESLPSMGAGGVVGRGIAAAAPRLAGVAAGALGEGVVGAGSSAEQIRQQTSDGLLTPQQSGLAAATGAGTAAFGMAGGKVAQKLGIGDIDTALAGGAAKQAGQAAQKGLFRRVGEGAISEGVLEEMPQSIQEQALQNIALGKDAGEGVGQAAALGMLSGGAMGGGFNIRAHAAAPAPSVADIGKAGSVDEAIAAANAAVIAPVGKLSSEDVEAEVSRIEAEARQAAQAPAALEAPAVPLADPVAGDILSPKGVPFQTEKMAALKARQGGGDVVAVNGGWVVRPAGAAPAAEVAAPAAQEVAAPLAPEATQPANNLPRTALSGFIGDHVNRVREISDASGLTQHVYDLSAAGHTAAEAVNRIPEAAFAAIDRDAELNGENVKSARIQAVRTLRTSLGIPSQDDPAEFKAWQDSVRGAPTAPTATAAPAAPEAPKPVEAPAAPQPIALEDMPLAALNARMGFIKNQVQANGGWNQMLIDERNRVQAEIDRRATPVAKADGERARPQWMEKANTTQAQEPGNESAVGNGADSGAGSAGAASGRVAEASGSPAQGTAGGSGAADAAVGSAGSSVSAAGNTTDAQPALTEPAPRTVTVAGEQVTLTPEQATQWDAAQSAHDKAVAVVEQAFQRSKGQATSENPDVGLKSAKERRDAELKRLGMELSAQRRKITDRLTAKERAAAGKSGASLRAGDRITVAGAAGTVKTNAYGRITVQMDGEEAPRRVPREQIVRVEAPIAPAADQTTVKQERPADAGSPPVDQTSSKEGGAPAAAEEATAESNRDAEPLERDRNGNAERRAPLTGEDRWEYPPVMRGEDPTLTAAKNKVVDYMNGDISRTELMTHLEQSGLPQGIVYSITQRIGEDGPSIGEVDAMLERRERGEPAPGAAPATVRERVMAKLTAKREAAAKPLDHGEINIPGRTNNINAELDRHKARQEAEAKAKAKRKEDAATLKENKARAKELFAEHGEAIIARHGEKLGAKDLRKTLDSMVKWEPKKFIALVEKFQKEQAAAREPAAEVEATPAPPKVRKSEVESTAHGMLATAKEKKAFAFKRVKELRQRIKDAPVGEKSALRLELIKAESRWREYQQMERDANSKIAEDAEAQGVTFRRGELDLSAWAESAAAMMPRLRKRRPSVRAEDLRAMFDPIIAQWKNGPTGGVTIVQSVDDLPPHLAEHLRSAGEDGRAEGFYLPKSGRVFLIADNLASTERAQQVLFHEVYGHKGLRSILSDAQYATMMERIRRANPEIAEAAAEWFANYGDDTIAMNMDAGQSEAEAERNARLLSVEEALADMAGTVPVAGPVKQLLATLQRALRAIGLDAVADWMEGKGEAETLKLLADARAAVFGATRKGETHVMAPDAAPAMSRQDAEDGDGYRFATEFLTELAQEDEMFRLPTSDAHTLEGVLADVDPTVEVVGDATREDERDESGADRRTLIRTAGGRDAYIFEKGRDVWLDVSRLDPGMGGDAIYQAVANYALNTRKQFVGDPAGLSPAAIVRRTYHMLGSALRFGTTDHFQPAIEQLEGLPDEGIPPLEWRGNDADKLASLAKVFLETLHHLNPDLSNVRYDFDKQRFFDGETPLERGRLEVLAPGGSGAARAGRRTAAAGVVLASLARASSSERSGLLARALQRPGQLVGGDFGPLFSRQVKEDESTGSEAAGAAQREPAQSVRDRIAEAGRQGRGRADEGDAAPLDGDTPAFSRAALGTNNPREFVKGATDTVSAYLSAPGKVSWWHKTVGTMYNLAKRSPEFRKVYDRVQDFINDVSFYANEAANLAPNIIPKLESIKDLTKAPISAADNKAISAPIFEGTLTWARDERGRPVKLEELEKRYEHLNSAQKADMLLQRRIVTEAQLKRWLASPLDIYDGAIRNRFQDNFLRAGVVFTDGELRDLFNLNDHQISLYREFRATVDKSLARLAIADMLRYGGKDIDDAMRARVMELDDSKKAGQMLSDRLMEIAEEDPERADVLMDSANTMLDKADRAKDLMEHGYAPLSRFGHYTLDVVDAEGKRVYFGMFESAREANQMAVKMRANFRGAKVTQGTVSEQAYKLFAGVSPETLELFGGMLGLESQGDDASSKAFQQYLKLAKANRSAMKRLIQRKGIAGFSEDVGRVLAGFVYSNARHTASTLHMGAISEAVNDIPQQQGEIKDMAINLSDYVKNPQEEAQAIRGLLFVQYLGGSLASAMVNMTQPFAVTMPYLSQFGGVANAAKQMAAAVKDAVKRKTGDAALDAALKTAEQEGIVAPQEVHHLMAQAQGRGALKSGDGTRLGDARAKVGNYYSKGLLLWGKPFALAEQFNRRATFIAAWRTAKEQGIKDPAKFAEQAIAETQFVYNKGNKPQWARGAVGGTLFTFKQYSISYLELLTRMAKSGPEGRKAALFMLAMMLLMGGAEGLPFMDDADDVIDGALQRLGYNTSFKQWKEEKLAEVFGEAGGRFLRTGISGLPGAPIDVSGRLGMGNVIPGTGFFTKKTDYSRDILELAGPAGDLGKRVFQGANQVLAGNLVKGATTAAPKAFSNMAQAYDMQVTGMYRDQKGRKVIDTDGYDALAKAIGFQPNDVARVQDAAVQQQQMIAVNRMREAEIADRWAQAEFAKDREKVAEAKAELKEWNEKNPDAPIAIKYSQIFRRVREMNKSKADRIAGTAPKEIRASVKRDLKEAVQH